MRIFRTSFLVRLSVVTLFLIGLVPGQSAVLAQDSETSHTNEDHNVTIEWTDAWLVNIPPDVNGTVIGLEQASSIFVTIAMIDSSIMPPEDGVWMLYQEGEEIVADNSSDDPPSASWLYEGTGILQYSEAYLVNDGDTTLIFSLASVPVMQATAIELVQSEITINGQPPLTGAIVADQGVPQDLTAEGTAGLATPATETPDATAEETEEATRSTRTTRGTTETPEVTEESTRSTRTTRGTSETPEETEEATEETTRSTRTTRDTAETPEATEEPGSGAPGMEVFTSMVFQFTVQYDPGIWERNETLDTANNDGLQLTGDSSTVFFFAIPTYGADPAACLAGESDYFSTEADRISNWEVALGADGEPLMFESDTLAWGVFTYTFTTSSGEEVEFVDYISCETVPGHDAVLIVQLSSLPDEYNDNLDAVLDILDTLEFQP